MGWDGMGIETDTVITFQHSPTRTFSGDIPCRDGAPPCLDWVEVVRDALDMTSLAVLGKGEMRRTAVPFWDHVNFPVAVHYMTKVPCWNFEGSRVCLRLYHWSLSTYAVLLVTCRKVKSNWTLNKQWAVDCYMLHWHWKILPFCYFNVPAGFPWSKRVQGLVQPAIACHLVEIIVHCDLYNQFWPARSFDWQHPLTLTVTLRDRILRVLRQTHNMGADLVWKWVQLTAFVLWSMICALAFFGFVYSSCHVKCSNENEMNVLMV